jgi:hypothetical protein
MNDHDAMEPTNGAQARTAPQATAELSLLIDSGSAWTKASVVGRTRGRWRIVAHAAQPSDWDEAVLIGSLAERARESVDHRLRAGVSEMIQAAPRISCHTPLRPGRLAIAAVSGEVSGAAARRAAESAGWTVVEAVAADDGRRLPDRLAALAAAEVDAWLVVGGFDDARPEQALESAALVAAARGGGRSLVVWAGSAALGAEVAQLFDSGVLRMVANPRPSASEEDLAPLRHHLEELLDRLVESGGTRNLAPIGFRRTIAEIAREERLRVAGVDLGARYATWVVADGTTAPVTADSRVFASGGLSSPTLAGSGMIARLARSLPLPIDELAVADTLQNMRARPGTIPMSDEELAVTHGAARLRLGALADHHGFGPCDLLIGAGRVLAAAPTPMHAMELLLDGLRPPGVTQLAVDVAGVLAPLGSLDDVEIGEGIGVLRDDLLVPLGTAVVTRGGRPGQMAMRVHLHRTGWPEPEPVELRTGEVRVLPLPRGERAQLEIELEPGITLPAARRTHRARVEVSGGTVGLVIDARDVPMQLPRRADDRREVLAGWHEQLMHEPLLSRPPEAPTRPSRRERLRLFTAGPAAWRRASGREPPEEDEDEGQDAGEDEAGDRGEPSDEAPRGNT